MTMLPTPSPVPSQPKITLGQTTVKILVGAAMAYLGHLVASGRISANEQAECAPVVAIVANEIVDHVTAWLASRKK